MQRRARRPSSVCRPSAEGVDREPVDRRAAYEDAALTEALSLGGCAAAGGCRPHAAAPEPERAVGEPDPRGFVAHVARGRCGRFYRVGSERLQAELGAGPVLGVRDCRKNKHENSKSRSDPHESEGCSITVAAPSPIVRWVARGAPSPGRPRGQARASRARGACSDRCRHPPWARSWSHRTRWAGLCRSMTGNRRPLRPWSEREAEESRDAHVHRQP